METNRLNFGMIFFNTQRERVKYSASDCININGSSSTIGDILRAIQDSSMEKAVKKCVKHPERLMVRKGSSKAMLKIQFDRFVAMEQVTNDIDCTQFGDDSMLFFVGVDKCSLSRFNEHISEDQLRLQSAPSSTQTCTTTTATATASVNHTQSMTTPSQTSPASTTATHHHTHLHSLPSSTQICTATTANSQPSLSQHITKNSNSVHVQSMATPSQPSPSSTTTTTTTTTDRHTHMHRLSLPPIDQLAHHAHGHDNESVVSTVPTIDTNAPSISLSLSTATSTSRKRSRSPSAHNYANANGNKKQRIDRERISRSTLMNCPLKRAPPKKRKHQQIAVKPKKTNTKRETKTSIKTQRFSDDNKHKHGVKKAEVFFETGQQEVLWILVDATGRTEGKSFDRIRDCFGYIVQNVWNDTASRTSYIGLYSFASKFMAEQSPMPYSTRAVQSMLQQFNAIKRLGPNSTPYPIDRAITRLLRHIECSPQFDGCKHRVLLCCGKHSGIAKANIAELADTLKQQRIIFDVFEISSTYRHSELERLTKSHHGKLWSIKSINEDSARDIEIMWKFLTCDVFRYAHHRVICKESAVVIDSD